MSEIYGNCHLCGKHSLLTKEHVPPQSAFNNNSGFLLKFSHWYGNSSEPKKHFQGGYSKYTLCSKCNNNTGSWYGSDFVDFCVKGDAILGKGYSGLLSLCFEIYPLRVIKQIVTMFFSVNGPNFRVKNPELVSFVLGKENKYLSPYNRIYCYFFTGNISKWMGSQGIANVFSGKIKIVSEIDLWPFGYVLVNSNTEDLCDITFFSRYNYDEKVIVFLDLPVKETNTAYPMDYRRKDKIKKGNGD